ncbi:MAG: hypothetical protein N3B18_09090 [Desulfobacterota bacterium]|nr:hypothetical protein [Thermodesulfobacteriota bacterium]
MIFRRHHNVPQHALVSGYERLRLLFIFVLVLFLFKILYSLSDLNIHHSDIRFKNIFIPYVSAKEKQPESSETDKASSQPIPDNASQTNQVQATEPWSIELAKALQERERELTAREDALRHEEERLNDLKRDIQERIQSLASLEKKISDLISAKKSIEEEKLMKLAKVFEETPPEQAGPLLSKLDVDIAAELLLKMTGRKAGKIWGYVDPNRAVDISKALARINPNITFDTSSDNKSAEHYP